MNGRRRDFKWGSPGFLAIMGSNHVRGIVEASRGKVIDGKNLHQSSFERMWRVEGCKEVAQVMR